MQSIYPVLSSWLPLLCVQDAAPCSGALLDAIKAKWGSLDNFISAFNTTTAAVQVGRVHATPAQP
jgi:superoxide dismutase